jgi:DNA polymerase-3 subunit epsilon
MKYAIIDTESNGLFDFTKPADADGQPRLANLAIVLIDEALNETSKLDFFIKPDGWEMTPEATAINGLTTEYLMQVGRPILEVLGIYSQLIIDGYVICTYNAQFDTKMMRGELRRAGMPDLFEQTPNICLMRASTNLCRVPKKTGSGYKFPKLAEACAFFKIEQTGAHSAMGDTLAAVAIFRAIHKANLLPAPEVHFAKVIPASKTLNP